MSLDASIFREYDVRGIVDDGLDIETVETIGRAFGTILRRKNKTRIAIGGDVRLSTEEFMRALSSGLLSTGIDVVDVGIVPTPVLYYAIINQKLDGGVMITGSHNPVAYNGLKICIGKLPLFGDEIQEIRRVAEKGEFASGDGTYEHLDLAKTYTADVDARFDFKTKKKIVIDCGNGVGGIFAPDMFRAAGHEVIELYTEPDGTFPNHLPDPEVPKYMVDLVNRVKSEGADIGFGFDGDADRLGVIDENGRKISADWLVIAFARDILKRHPGGVIRYDVKCSDFLVELIEAAGGKPVMGRTGHSILKRELVELDAVLGGELSGHIVFGRDYYPIDDPFYCALTVLRLMEELSVPCSGLFEGIPETFATAEIKAPCADDKKFDVVADLVRVFSEHYEVLDVDGARVRMPKAQGWGLVRASNTTANLTLRFESLTKEGLGLVRDRFLTVLKDYDAIDLGPVREALS